MDVTATIIQIADKIMEDLGAGYSESIYQNALHRKLVKLDETCTMEKIIPVVYDGDILGICRADLVMLTHVIEVKAVRKMPSGAGKQVCKYVKHLSEMEEGKVRVGLVINFNQESERIETIEFPAEQTTDVKRRKFTPVDE